MSSWVNFVGGGLTMLRSGTRAESGNTVGFGRSISPIEVPVLRVSADCEALFRQNLRGKDRKDVRVCLSMCHHQSRFGERLQIRKIVWFRCIHVHNIAHIFQASSSDFAEGVIRGGDEPGHEFVSEDGLAPV